MMYIVMFSEALLLQCLDWLTVVLHCVKEHCTCVSLGGTAFVLFVIMVLCIAISCVLWKMHSLIYLKIFAVSDELHTLVIAIFSSVFLAGKITGRIWEV